MKTRWKILIGLAAALGIVVVAAVAHHFQLKAAVNRYWVELKADGVSQVAAAGADKSKLDAESRKAAIDVHTLSLQMSGTTAGFNRNEPKGHRNFSPLFPTFEFPALITVKNPELILILSLRLAFPL